jgi:PAS domain S-box-containing protein
MTILSWVFAGAFGVYIFLTGLVILRNPRSALNWFAAGFLVCFALWSFEDVFHSLYPLVTESQARVFGNVGGIGGYCFASFYLLFALALTGHQRALRSWLTYVPLVGLPAIFIITQWTGLGAVDYRPGPFGWAITWTPTLFSIAYYAYYLTFMVLSLWLIARFGRRATQARQQTQAAVVFVTTLITLVLATTSDVILPLFSQVRVPELGGAWAVIWAGGLFVGIAQYGLMPITAQAAAEEILATMLDAVVLTDQAGTVVRVNPALHDLFGYAWSDIVGQPAGRLFAAPLQFQELLQRVLVQGRIDRTELVCRAKNGFEVPVAATGRVMAGRPRKATGIVWVLRDITRLKQAEQQLRESEEKYRDVVERANDGIIVIQDESVKYANPRMAELDGSSVAELIGSRMAAHIHPSALPELVSRYRRRMAGEAIPQMYETLLQRKDGTPVPAELNAGLVLFEGRPADLVIIRDISERKRAEEAVRQERDRARTYLDLAQVIIVALNPDRSVSLINRRGSELLGYPASEIIGRDWFQHFVPERLRPAVGGTFEELVHGQTALAEYFENPVITRSGEERTIAWHNTLLRDEQGRITGTLSSGEDVTQLKQSELQLRESEQKYREVVERATDGIVIIQDDVIRYANPRIGEIYRRPLSEILGTPFRDHLHPDSLPGMLERYRRRIAGEALPSTYEAVLLRGDGTRFTAELNATVVTFADRPADLVLVRDITERKQAEEKLKRTLEELTRSNAELQQFAYVASHDLQEPLRMVSSFVQLLAKRYSDKLDAEAGEYIGFALNGASRMHHLISDLLAFSRVGTRGKPFQPFAAGDALQEAIANLQLSIQDTGASVTSDPLPEISGDQSQFVQLFQNLIENAVKFHGSEPSRVHVAATTRDSEVVFTVKDNGIGIDPRHFERIFTIFQRLHAPGKYAGTGIGLAICKKIVERHAGRIWVESEEGKGSTFYFSVPSSAA